MGAAFSRSKPAAEPQENCPANCKERYQERQDLMSRTKDKARYQQENHATTPQTGTALAAAKRFDQYNEAMVHARAAANVYDPSKPGTCLTNLSNDPDKANAALGFPPGTLTAKDFEDPKTGFRAALYRSDSNGKLILAYAGTNPSSLADWKTNIDNGDGLDTEQYKDARQLAAKLSQSDQGFDITGHSKGGGLATEAGLIATKAKVWTFNSAGLNPASLLRTGTSDFAKLTARTQAFHNGGDFLTALQTEKDPATQIKNAQFLRDSFQGSWWNKGPLEKLSPLKILKENSTAQAVDPTERSAFFQQLDGLIDGAKKKLAAGEKFNLFPTAVGQSQAIGKTSSLDNLRLFSLYRHTMPPVMSDLEKGKTADQKTMNQFLKPG